MLDAVSGFGTLIEGDARYTHIETQLIYVYHNFDKLKEKIILQRNSRLNS